VIEDAARRNLMQYKGADMKIENRLKTLWGDAAQGFACLLPDVKKRTGRNLVVAGACTILSSLLLTGSLLKTPRDEETAAINAFILAAIGYYATKTGTTLINLGRIEKSLAQYKDALVQTERLQGTSPLAVTGQIGPIQPKRISGSAVSARWPRGSSLE
jgi:hypothetical protein